MDYMYNTLKNTKTEVPITKQKSTNGLHVQYLCYNQNTSITNEKEVHNSMNGDN